MKNAGIGSALVVAVGIAAALALTSLGQGSTRASSTHMTFRQSYAKLPLAFEPNRGQSEQTVRFLARGSGYALALRSTDALLALEGKGGKPNLLRMRLLGADARSSFSVATELPGKVNYLLGNDRSRWTTGIPTYAAVSVRGVYPGVDLRYHGKQGWLEYDFVVRPGSDPNSIALRFQGARSLRLDRGDLLVELPSGTLRQRAPLVYQQSGSSRTRIEGGFTLHAGRVGFALGPYDPTRTLVIDPVLVYSSYLGGNDTDIGHAIAVDAAGSVYVTGRTFSMNFPTVPVQPINPIGNDVFVTKLNPAGSAFAYSTLVGGSGFDEGFAIAVDATGSAYVTGDTTSLDFPIAGMPVQPISHTGRDAFVTKLNPAGTALSYSTYLGGTTVDSGHGIAVDRRGTPT